MSHISNLMVRFGSWHFCVKKAAGSLVSAGRQQDEEEKRTADRLLVSVKVTLLKDGSSQVPCSLENRWRQISALAKTTELGRWTPLAWARNLPSPLPLHPKGRVSSESQYGSRRRDIGTYNGRRRLGGLCTRWSRHAARRIETTRLADKRFGLGRSISSRHRHMPAATFT